MIGISEGIVLADRYRLTRRQSERETGASWIAVDLETGSDVWVQFADHGGLARAADIIRGLADSSSHATALPSVLDTGELRMIVDSRALAALRGGAEAHATHVEIVIEFAVVRPLTGRGLPAKIQRRALPPAEALAVAVTLAGALGEALAAGGSHGWLGTGSIWLVRRGGCVLDLALGLAYPDGSAIELEQQVTGYFAPERFALAREANAAVGSGSKATQAADVFALGWMVYEMLIGHAELLAEYERLVAGAGAVTTVELLALWRARARAHLTELVEADSALAVLILACLAENPAERPDFAAFGERARAAAKGLAGVAPLVVPVSRTRAGAAAGEVGAAALVAGVIGGAAVLGAAAVGAELLAGEAMAAEASAESRAAAQSAGAGGALGTGGSLGAGGSGAEAAATQSAGMAELADTGAGSATSAAGSGEGAGSAASAASATSAESAVVAEAETVVLAAAAAAGVGVGAASAAEALTGSGAASGVSASGSASGAASSGAEFASEGFVGSGSVSGSETEVSVAAEKEIERLSHRARLATIGGTAAAVVALGVGIAVGYSIGHGGGSNNSALLTAAGTNAAGTVASPSSSPVVAAPAPTVTVTVTVTASESAPATSASAAAGSAASGSGSSSASASASAGAVTSPGLPAASSSTEAINELTEEIQYTLSVGQISQSTAERLTAAVAKLRSSLGTGSSSSSLSSLTSLLRSLEQSGHLPSNAELTLESILGYFYAESGS
ncbi:hypothetical protein KDL01_19220 [Actinospica durhamensis]|uniref:non-specific serine/threonine protein kinase n=1 Tax=Actinospica durhamensis TaxID=1508375 RepID=A0A941EWU8_9ACTN|nr:hypothetical protein [Actinospica durhamensis]MBR7835414.1 hypothetical protein [Actinospica durhamensis]